MLRKTRSVVAGVAMLFLLQSSALAAPPELLSYQGVLLDAAGVAVQDGMYSLEFTLYPQAAGGTSVFEQTLGVEVRRGLYNIVLSNNASYDLGDATSQNPQLFMEVTILADGSTILTDIVLSPRQQLTSVPFALSAPPPAVGALVPLGGIILWDLSPTCPPSYQEAIQFASRFPIGADTASQDIQIADAPGSDGGTSGAASPWHTQQSSKDRPKGPSTEPQFASDLTHEHVFVPPHRTVLFCRRIL